MNDLRRFWKWLLNTNQPLPLATLLMIIELVALGAWLIIAGFLILLGWRPSTAEGER